MSYAAQTKNVARLSEIQPMNWIKKATGLCLLLTLGQLLRAALPEGYVIQWGWNTAYATSAPPKLVLSNAVAVAAGDGYSLALRGDETVFGWGGNHRGNATGDPMTNSPFISASQVRIGGKLLSNVVSIAADRGFSLALKKDGTVVTWGENYLPGGLTNIAAIAVGWSESWVLKRDGTIVGWLSDTSSPGYEQLLSVEHLSNVVAIATGHNGHRTRGVALLRDGTVGHWGGETIHKDATPPAGLSAVVAIAAGDNHSLALKSDGTVIGWGFNTFGQATGTPTTNSPNTSSGPVLIGGQVLTNAVSIAASREYSLALKQDGTVVSWGRMVNGLYPVNIPAGLSNVIAIAAGENSCLAITMNSAVAERFRR
jgi:alpha-tubulin suppressor-like RCC1 family protein